MTTKFNVCIFGDSKVGKTSMISVLTGQGFSDSVLSTIGIANAYDNATIDDRKYKVKIIDTAGQETYSNIANAQVRQGDGFILTYSINSRSSFSVLGDWLNRINSAVDIKTTPVVIAGNKCDLQEQREVSKEEGEKYAKDRGFEFLETSAKDNINIKEIFEILYRKIHEKILKKEGEEKEKNSFQIGKNNEKNPKKKKWC